MNLAATERRLRNRQIANTVGRLPETGSYFIEKADPAWPKKLEAILAELARAAGKTKSKQTIRVFQGLDYVRVTLTKSIY